MAYEAQVRRGNPALLFFVVDQSGSMDERMGIGEKSKAQFVADALNKNLYTLYTLASKADGVRDYFEVAVLGYSGSRIDNAFAGPLARDYIQPISAIAQYPLRIEERTQLRDDGAGGVIEQAVKFPVWFDPWHDGGTPMATALRLVADQVATWCDAHPASFPPIIMHFTDGGWTDEDPSPIADAIRRLATDDGETLLCNLHISAADGKVEYPNSVAHLTDPYGQQLFRLSSSVPRPLQKLAGDVLKRPIDSETKLYVFNGDAKSVVEFIEIGTRIATGTLDPNR